MDLRTIVTASMILFVSPVSIVGAEPARDAESDFGKLVRSARELLELGQPSDALGAAKEARALLPAPEAPRWALPYEGAPVDSVLLGRSHGYVLFEQSRSARPEHPLVVPSERLFVAEPNTSYDFSKVITCVDLEDGSLLWTRMTPGRMRCAVDLETDELYLWRRRLFVLDPEEGTNVVVVELGRDGERLDGIVRNERTIVPGRAVLESWKSRRYARVYDCDRESIREIDVLAPFLTSPDGTKMIGPSFAVHEISDGPSTLLEAPRLWTLGDGFAAHLPFWVGGRIVAANGSIYTRSEVRCLDAESGKARWSFVLPRGISEASRNRSSGGTFPADGWGSVARLGPYVMALGGSGEIFLLDPDSGRLEVRSTLSSGHLHIPKLYKRSLVLSEPRRLRALPFDDVIRRDVPRRVDLEVLHAQILAALGRPADALSLLLEVVDSFPDDLEPWRALGSLYESLGEPDNELAARCRYLALSRDRHSPRLQEQWGLLQRIPIGEDMKAPVTLFDGRLVVGTKAGHLWSVRGDSCDLVLELECPKEIVQLQAESRLQSSQGTLLKRVPAHEASLSENDLAAFLDRIGDRSADGSLLLRAADGATVCLVRGCYPNATVEIWSRDGMTLHRRETIRDPGYVRHLYPHLIPLGRGYVLVGKELLWISRDASQPVWRFGRRSQVPHAVPSVHFEHTTFYVGAVEHEGRLFVNCRDGGLYVFDIARMTGGA